MTFEISPQKLVYGGKALGHYQGRTVLVTRALPGERLEVKPARTAKGVLHAQPLQVLHASPERVDPPCPYFGSCGGCQYQHIAPQQQPLVKREILRETLRRIGKINWDSEIALHTAQPWNFRNQAQLKVTTFPNGHVKLGFFEAESHQLVDVDACLILSPQLNAMLGKLREPEWSYRLARCRELDLLADDRDEHVMLTLRGSFSQEEGEALAQDLLTRLPSVQTVAIDRGEEPRIFGERALMYRVDEYQYRISPGSFFQASRFLLPELVRAVTADVSGSLALDLFAGVGLFTHPLANRFAQVIAVEARPNSARDLAANAKARELPNVRAVAETTFDFLRRFAQTEPDLVVLDPPRAGVGIATINLLTRCRPRRIHYVSCSPPTLARDLGYLIKQGYQLNHIELFDFFPQTYHIECLAQLTRSSLAGT